MDDDKLGKRRATNRRSQKRTREHKESLMKSLQEENELLKERLENRSVPTPLCDPYTEVCSQNMLRLAIKVGKIISNEVLS